LLRHEPFIGERRLRQVTGKHVERPTVPVLVAGAEVLRESWDIVRYADREGGASPLIPAELEPAIRELHDLAERAMMEGRRLVTAGLLASDAALDDAQPKFVPVFARPLLRPLSRFGTRWFARKYALDLDDLVTPRRALAETLEQFRARYAGRPYLFDRFTYADIAFCVLLQGVSPVDDRYIRLTPAWRIAWTQPELAARFPDLVRQRDRLYAEHRGARRAP
jgi:glutathione S-transferase